MEIHFHYLSVLASRWTAHDRAMIVVIDQYGPILELLATCLNERNDPKSLDLFLSLRNQESMATILMLRDIFESVQPLNLALQKGDGTLCIADIPVYLNSAITGLEK